MMLALVFPFFFVLILLKKMSHIESSLFFWLGIIMVVWILFDKKRREILVPPDIINLITGQELAHFKKMMREAVNGDKKLKAWAESRIKETEETLREAGLLV